MSGAPGHPAPCAQGGDHLARWLADGTALYPLLVDRDGIASEAAAQGRAQRSMALVVLAGSFNPLHAGHRGMAEAATALTGREVLFELSVTNVDKPPLAESDVRARLAQFHGVGRVVLTRAPRFVEKARALPGSTFVLGWDTFVRLLDERYYESAAAMHVAIREMRDLGCGFLVAGRVQSGVFRSLEAASIPAEFASMFQPIPESRFRLDISSTELRGRAGSP